MRAWHAAASFCTMPSGSYDGQNSDCSSSVHDQRAAARIQMVVGTTPTSDLQRPLQTEVLK